MLTLLATLCCLSQASSPDRLETALKKFGEVRSYRMDKEGMGSMTMTLRTKIVARPDRKVAVFEDEIDMKMGEEAAQIKITETASLEGLRLLSRVAAGRDEKGPVDWSVDVKEGVATMTGGGRRQTLSIPGRTIGEGALLRFFGTVEQKVGTSHSIDLISMAGESLDQGISLRCVAREPVEIAGKKFEAFRWEEKYESKSVIDGVPTTVRRDAVYWICPDGYPLKFGSGGMEFVLVQR